MLHSGFPHEVKQHWVAPRYWLPGPEGNDIQKTNVPNLRMRFRWDCLSEERELVKEGAGSSRRRKAAREARAAADRRVPLSQLAAVWSVQRRRRRFVRVQGLL